MVPAVWRTVCGSPHRHYHATLRDYARFSVRNHVFPGIVQQAGAQTDGIVIEDIDVALWRAPARCV